MNQLRHHIVRDLSVHVANEVRTVLQRHISVCQHSDVSPAEGVAIMTLAAVDVVTFMAGAATILSDPQDVDATFDGALKAITAGVQVARDPIVASLANAIAQMRAAQS